MRETVRREIAKGLGAAATAPAAETLAGQARWRRQSISASLRALAGAARLLPTRREGPRRKTGGDRPIGAFFLTDIGEGRQRRNRRRRMR